MRDPLFPGGIGIVAPAIGGLWPLWPPMVYAGLELGSWLGLIIWQARRREVTSDGLVLALIPLFFAWRSFGTYFALVPLLALWLIASRMRDRAPTLHAEKRSMQGKRIAAWHQ